MNEEKVKMDENVPPIGSKSILLVDTEQFIIVAYKDGLERAGYRVTVVQDGEAALNTLHTMTPDLIILDLMLPKMNGFELLQSIKSSDEYKSIPVLVLTNLSQANDEAEARSFGIVDFMVKADVSLQDLLIRLDELLARN